MDVEVTSGTIATLIEEAHRAHPRECCGLLLGQGTRIGLAQPAANVHPDPEGHKDELGYIPSETVEHQDDEHEHHHP